MRPTPVSTADSVPQAHRASRAPVPRTGPALDVRYRQEPASPGPVRTAADVPIHPKVTAVPAPLVSADLGVNWSLMLAFPVRA